ncbi:hypothetical protein, partial [Bacillus timonensis]|uniref:hypothetical protein n=1 Tax=Bacillus timonensis TaxID=1033734 RepID=UPI0002890C80
PFLSEVLNEQISKDLNKGTLKKVFLKPEYKKEFKADSGSQVLEKIEFSDDINHPKKYTMLVNGTQESFIEIKNIQKQEKSIKVENFIDIEELKKDGVSITEIK